MQKSSAYLKVYAASSTGDELGQTIDDIWKKIREKNLYAGQPRSPDSIDAISLCKLAFRVASDSGNKRLISEACRMTAYTLNANEQYEEAIPYYRQAIGLLEGLGDSGQAARMRLGFVAALYMTGNYEEALEAARVADQWFTKSGDVAGLARLYTNLGNLCHRVEDHVRSLEYHTRANTLFSELGDQKALALSYLNLGNSLSCIDQFDHADRMYECAEKLSRQLSMQELYAQARYNRAYLHFLRARYQDALKSYSQLKEFFQKSGSRRHAALCDLDVTEVYLHLRLPKEAIALATATANSFKQLGMSHEEAKAMTFLGVALTQNRDFEEALSALQRAQKIFEQERNLYWTAVLDLCQAHAFFSLRRLEIAGAFAINAKKKFESLNIVGSKKIAALDLLARIALESDHSPQADTYISEILRLTRNMKN